MNIKNTLSFWLWDSYCIYIHFYKLPHSLSIAQDLLVSFVMQTFCVVFKSKWNFLSAGTQAGFSRVPCGEQSPCFQLQCMIASLEDEKQTCVFLPRANSSGGTGCLSDKWKKERLLYALKSKTMEISMTHFLSHLGWHPLNGVSVLSVLLWVVQAY